MDEFEHHYVEVNGVRLHYAAAGAGDPVLFIHGFPEFWYSWRHQLRGLKTQYRVIAPDMRGYNLSEKPKDISRYAMAQLIEDIRALIIALGYERVHLVAHDWGGAVAWNFAIRYPELLNKFVIVNSPHPFCFVRELQNNRRQREASQYIRLFRSAEAESRLSADDFDFLWRFTYAGSHRRQHLSDAEKAAYLEAWARPGALTGSLNWYRAMPFDVPLPDDLESRLPPLDPENFVVRVPTLVIWGMKDAALLPELLNDLDRFVPNGSIIKVDDGTHWVVEECPDLVNKELLTFFGK